MDGILFNLPNPQFEPQGRLPAGYTEVSHIESDGNSWIDTLLSATSGFRIVTDFRGTFVSNQYYIICGAHALASPYKRNFVGLSDYYSSSRRTVLMLGIGDGDIAESTRSVTDNSWYHLDASTVWADNYIKIDGAAKALTQLHSAVSNSYSDRSLGLFGNNNTASGASQLFVGAMKETMLFLPTQEEAVRDFVPCINPQNEVGMYDLVTETFFGNAGTDDFIPGEPV